MTTRRREAHAHVAALGRAMAMPSVEAASSRDECLRMVARACDQAKGAPRSRWVIAWGMRAQGWPDPRPPTARELDDVAGDRPCVVRSFDYHSLTASSAALTAASITDATPDPDNGVIVRERGRATGVLLEAAATRLLEAAPDPTRDELLEDAARALSHLRSLGFTEVHDLHAPLELGPVLAELNDEGRLGCDVWLYPAMRHLKQAASEARARGGWERPRVRLAGGKLFADGTLNSRTASMLHPFRDGLPEHPRGQAMLTVEQIARAIAQTHDLGVGLAVHAIGDAAVRTSLDAFERVAPSLGQHTTWRGPGSPRVCASGMPSFRVEHAEVLDAADVPRFAELGVVCSVQPCHLLSDVEALERFLPHRLDRVLPLAELAAAGCAPGELMWFGSDAPIVRPNAEDSIQAAVHRRRPADPVSRSIAPSQALSEAQAWRAFEG